MSTSYLVTFRSKFTDFHGEPHEGYGDAVYYMDPGLSDAAGVEALRKALVKYLEENEPGVEKVQDLIFNSVTTLGQGPALNDDDLVYVEYGEEGEE